MQYYASSVAKLIDEFAKMPGIGHKTAQRLAFYILHNSRETALELSQAIINAKETIKLCSICQNLTDIEPCIICSDNKRDKSTICVVEWPKDLVAIEKTREYNGQYHILHGAISPIEGIGPGDIKIMELLRRMESNEIKEVIIATNTSVEGEATGMYVSKLLQPFNIATTRLAHGIPIGSDLEFTDSVTITKALEGRQEIR